MKSRILRAGGEYRWVVDTARPQFTDEGEFLGFAGVCFQVSLPCDPNRRNLLTAGEIPVPELVAEGKSTKQIAVLLGIS